MEHIIEPSIDFDFSKLLLASPSSLNGGAYFTRFFLNNKPVYIQTPKSLTKQGFVKSGKKIYADLLFDHNDTILIQWLENLETKCQQLIYEKGTQWFESALEQSDIESAFTSPIKLFKSGKFYLLRVNVKPNIKVYNERDEIISVDDVTSDMNIISILEIQGIKFTSRNFQIEIELKQSMVVSPDPFLDECFIKKPITRNTSIKQTTLETKPEPLPIETSQQQHTTNEYKDNSTQKTGNVDLPETNVATSNNLETIHNILNNEELMEVDINDIENNTETMSLKKPNEVYYEIYKAAREKAKQIKQEAILAFLEAKNIKKTYMLEDMDDSASESDFENYSEVSDSEF